MKFSSRMAWAAEPNALAALLQSKRASGAQPLDLTVSNPTQAGLPYDGAAILDALRDEAALRYDPAPFGLGETRCAVAAAYGYYPARVVLTSSTSESYSWLFKLLCDPGDEVLAPRPSYPLFDHLAALESVRLVHYPLRYAEGWWIDFDALRAAVTPRTRAIVVVNPNNPTGSFVKPPEWDRLASLCEEFRCAVVSDEVFAEFDLRDAAGGPRPLPHFLLGGLSKACGLPQMKLGWIAVGGDAAFRQQALQRLELIADTYLPVSAPVQRAAVRWLAKRRVFQAAVLERVRSNLAATPWALDVEGGWTAVIRLPRTRTEEAWVLGLLDDCGLLVQPGYFYDFETEAFAVVSLIAPEDVYREGMRRLKEYVNAHS